jgi:cellulose synthase/poly-beta-1,6-N-acetylglucosamine synthase-like glycosyltransferase
LSVGVVAIGRNEGERLRRCLQSALAQCPRVVYVDSGSTDGSVAMAAAMGVAVVNLDMSQPFTAARARNAGYERLKLELPDLRFVQFVDGDCEIVAGWIDAAVAFTADKPTVGVVCGRRRERHPEATVYNRLCDIEWDTPVGQTRACGGDALYRTAAFEDAGGFAPDLIAGEEPELCFRLRARGWEVWRIDREMTMHDAAMQRFGQWWKRNVRSGHAYAEWVQRHGASPERMGVREVVSNVVWSIPLAWPLWPLLFWRVYRRRPDAAYAAAIVVGKLPHLQGHLKFWLDRARGRHGRIIEYK